MEVYSVKQSGTEMAKPSLTQYPVEQGRSPRQEPIEQKPEPKTKTEPVKKAEIKFPKLLEIAQQVQEKLKDARVSIEFEVNKDSGRVIIKVMDPTSGEVLRKIPPEALEKSVEYLKEMKSEMMLQGIEVDVRY